MCARLVPDLCLLRIRRATAPTVVGHDMTHEHRVQMLAWSDISRRCGCACGGCGGCGGGGAAAAAALITSISNTSKSWQSERLTLEFVALLRTPLRSA